jgi:cytochrome c oxidase subunit 3
MRELVVLDISQVSQNAKESASATWWGTLAFMLLEGTGFALAIAIYLYLMGHTAQWPIRAPKPDLLPGTILTVMLLASLVPNWLINRWADADNMPLTRIGLVVMSLFGIAPLVPRAFEFAALHTSWDSSAYGSAVWLLLGLHTTHIITDLIDTLVLAAVMFTRHGYNKRRFGDVQDNALYWYFVVFTWLPIYVCMYWVPRL